MPPRKSAPDKQVKTPAQPRKKRTPKQAAPPMPAEELARDGTPQHAGAREWSHGWMEPFLTALEVNGIVARACAAAGVPRRTAYNLRGSDPEFAQAWKEAEYAGSEALIEEAYRRAVEGVKEEYYSGDNKITVTKYSDALLQTLLKAKRPEEFRERNDNRNVNLGPEELDRLTDDELRQLAGLK